MGNLITTAELADLYIRHNRISVKEYQEDLKKSVARIDRDWKLIEEDEKRLGKARRKWREYFSWKKAFKKYKYKNLYNAIKIKHIGV